MLYYVSYDCNLDQGAIQLLALSHTNVSIAVYNYDMHRRTWRKSVSFCVMYRVWHHTVPYTHASMLAGFTNI